MSHPRCWAVYGVHSARSASSKYSLSGSAAQTASERSNPLLDGPPHQVRQRFILPPVRRGEALHIAHAPVAQQQRRHIPSPHEQQVEQPRSRSVVLKHENPPTRGNTRWPHQHLQRSATGAILAPVGPPAISAVVGPVGCEKSNRGMPALRRTTVVRMEDTTQASAPLTWIIPRGVSQRHRAALITALMWPSMGIVVDVRWQHAMAMSRAEDHDRIKTCFARRPNPAFRKRKRMRCLDLCWLLAVSRIGKWATDERRSQDSSIWQH